MLAALVHMGERGGEGEGARERNRGVLGAMEACSKLMFESDGLLSKKKKKSPSESCSFRNVSLNMPVCPPSQFKSPFLTLSSGPTWKAFTVIHLVKDFLFYWFPLLSFQRPSRARTSSAAQGRSVFGTLAWAGAAARCVMRPVQRAGRRRRCVPVTTPHIPVNVPWSRLLVLWGCCWKSSTQDLATVSKQQKRKNMKRMRQNTPQHPSLRMKDNIPCCFPDKKPPLKVPPSQLSPNNSPRPSATPPSTA